ncbi:hypothetical protein ACFLWZ_07865 [Chloroflexota bacterium]
MPEQDEQFRLFSDNDFAPKNIEPITNLEKSHVIESCVTNDCFYYLCAGNCVKHGDTMGCRYCDDYKCINGDDIQDDGWQ